MAKAARLGDSISGMTSGEHSGHNVSCSPSAITGQINGECATNVFINGRPAAIVGSTTEEHDSCCGTASGSVASGSSKVFVKGKPMARVGDAISAHNGTATVSSGSDNVNINK